MKKILGVSAALLVLLAACTSPKLDQFGPVTIYTTST